MHFAFLLNDNLPQHIEDVFPFILDCVLCFCSLEDWGKFLFGRGASEMQEKGGKVDWAPPPLTPGGVS